MPIMRTLPTSQNSELAEAEELPPSTAAATILPEVLDIARILAQIAVDEFFTRPVATSERFSATHQR